MFNLVKGIENIVLNVDIKSNNVVDGGINVVSLVFMKIVVENIKENVLKNIKINFNDSVIYFKEIVVKNKVFNSIVDVIKKMKYVSLIEKKSLNVFLNLNFDVK